MEKSDQSKSKLSPLLESKILATGLINVFWAVAVAVDAEWGWTDPIAETTGKGKKQNTKQGLKAEYISVQFAFSDAQGNVKLTVVFLNDRYPEPTNKVVSGHDVLVVRISSLGFENLLERFTLPEQLTLLMFYSPKDMQGVLGADLWREMLLATVTDKNGVRKAVEKRRRLNVAKFKVQTCVTPDRPYDCEIEVKDLIGMFNSSLDKALQSVGIDNPFKALAEKEVERDGKTVKRNKSRMDLFALEDPDEFLKYGVGDVLDLHRAMLLKIDQTNEILEKAFGFKETYDSQSMKLTSGALVADVFEKWLIRKHPELFKAVLMLSSSNSDKDWAPIKKIRNHITSGVEIDLEKANREIKHLSSAVHGLSAGSIRAFYPGNYGTGTVGFGAVVQGGRCINERPEQKLIKGKVLDIDLSGCYGSALMNFDYPFGLPTVFCKNVDNVVITLGEFLKNEENDLVNGLYTIYVDGELSFNQDLIHSKYGLDTKKISSQLYGEEWEDHTLEASFEDGRDIETAHIEGNFLLTTKQIEKGIITADNLKVIRSVATEQELKEWMNLSVECAVWYPKSKEVSVDQFISVCKNAAKRGLKKGDSDTRSKVWCRLPLEEFIGQFIAVRKAYKTEMKAVGNDKDPNYKRLDLLQTSVKLFVNTTYGCLAAPYFPVGNTVLANNITAKARTGVWMLAKALNTVQSITDGGMYNPDQAHSFKVGNANFKKPGFNYLYLRNQVSYWSRSVGEVKLFTTDIIKQISDVLNLPNETKIEKEEKARATGKIQELIDSTATDHINEFWSLYGLSLPFEIEHKIDNTGTKAAYIGSGDYAIKTVKGDKIYVKTRGTKDDEHPKKLLLKALLNETPINEVKHTFLDSKQLGVSEFQKIPGEEFLPGDDIQQPTALKPKKHSGQLFETFKDWERAEKAHEKAKGRYEKENQNKALTDWSRFPTIE